MAKQPKLFDKIDAKVEGREGLKTVWQAGKFSLFSIVAFLIQTILQLVLPLIFDRMATPLPGWLSWIINPGTLSPEQQALYVVAGVVTWGYLLPFFLFDSVYDAYCAANQRFPLWMAFLKFGILATFGEMKVNKLKTAEKILSSITKLPKERQEEVKDIMGELIQSSTQAVRDRLSDKI